MKILLQICTLLFISLSAHALDYNHSTEEVMFSDSIIYTTNTPATEFYYDDGGNKINPSSSKNPSNAVGAIIGGVLGLVIFQMKNCDDKTGANGDEKVGCEMEKSFGSVLLGIPLGALVGYGITAAYSAKNKSAFISTKLEF